MTTLDSFGLFKLGGAVSRIMDWAVDYIPVLKYNPDAVAIALAEVLVTAARVMPSGLNRPAANAVGMMIGPPHTGKSATMSLIQTLLYDAMERLIVSDVLPIILIEGSSSTPEYIEQKMYETYKDYGFATCLITIDEFGRTLADLQRGGYLSGLLWLLKHVYDLNGIASGRVTKESRIIPTGAHYTSVILALTFEDYRRWSRVLDNAFLRRILPITFTARAPRRMRIVSAVDYGKRNKAIDTIVDMCRMQVTVTLDDGLAGEADACMAEIENACRVADLPEELIDAACDAYTTLVVWRAFDRCYAEEKLEEVEMPADRVRRIKDAKRRVIPYRCYISREDLRVVFNYVHERIIRTLAEMSVLTDELIERILNKVNILLERESIVTLRDLAKYTHLRYEHLREALRTLVALGFIEIYTELGGDPIAPEDLGTTVPITGKLIIAKPGAMPGVKSERLRQARRRLMDRLSKKPAVRLRDLDEDELMAIARMLREGAGFIIHMANEYWFAVDPVYARRAENSGAEVFYGEDAVEHIRRILGR